MSLAKAFDVFRPPPDEPMLHWLIRNAKNERDEPYDHFRIPHVGAPGGPLEAFQDPLIREIYLQWATRNAKTYFGLWAMLWTSAVWPSPCFFASASKPLVEDIIGDRAWKMAENCGQFGRLPREGRRPKKKIRLPRCQWYSGWAESSRTLADKSAKIVHGNEIPKWRHLRGTSEADPWELAKERAKEWPDRKIIGEGSPTIRKKCRIETATLGGTHCRLNVPCPRCVKWQRLNLGKGERGGIVFDRGHGGRADPEVAKRTARYACLHCGGELRNDVRPWMMRRGVWVPEGCDVDHERAAKLFDGLADDATHWQHPKRPYAWNGWPAASWIRGQPVRDGEIASYQLSTLYSLAVGWGAIAQEFVKSDRPGRLQNFVNSWLAETFEDERREAEWEAIAKRLQGEAPTERGTVPVGMSTVVVGIDRQKSHFVFVVLAAGPGRRCAIVDWGTRETYDEIERDVLLRTYPHADEGEAVFPRRAFCDTGYQPAGEDGSTIYGWCRRTTAAAAAVRQLLRVYGCKGANHQLRAPFEESTLPRGTNCPGAKLVHVDPYFSQDWVEQMLYRTPADNPGGLRLPAGESYELQDLVEQLRNDVAKDVTTTTNTQRTTWVKAEDETPNDFRDCLRYALAALLHAIRNGEVPIRVKESIATEYVESSPVRAPDGRAFLVTVR